VSQHLPKIASLEKTWNCAFVILKTEGGQSVDYESDMRQCLQYIDEHIHEGITPRFLAQRFHYSFYHFCHIFRIYNDMSVGRYLRKRRLERAVCEFRKGKSITEIALAYGYDTVSGFFQSLPPGIRHERT
jgi:AraC-type DNA-binding domain-containing proteins